MTLPPSDLPALPTTESPQTLQHQRRLTRLSVSCASGALVAAAIWTPLMVFIAIKIHPHELDQFAPSNEHIVMLQHDAALQLGVVLIASFLLIPALAEVAIIAGRKARGFGTSDATLRQLDMLGAWSLAISVLGAVVLVVFGVFDVFPEVPLAIWGAGIGFVAARFERFLYPVVVVVGVNTIVLSTLNHFVLQRIMAGKASGYASGQPERRRWRRFLAILAQGVPLLILLLWFVIVSLIAEFIATFYLYFVF